MIELTIHKAIFRNNLTYSQLGCSQTNELVLQGLKLDWAFNPIFWLLIEDELPCVSVLDRPQNLFVAKSGDKPDVFEFLELSAAVYSYSIVPLVSASDGDIKWLEDSLMTLSMTSFGR